MPIVAFHAGWNNIMITSQYDIDMGLFSCSYFVCAAVLCAAVCVPMCRAAQQQTIFDPVREKVRHGNRGDKSVTTRTEVDNGRCNIDRNYNL